MKKVILSASLLVGITATAQVDYEKRVGVNTDKPRASLEVRAINFNGITQGILFPHIDEDEKARWTKNNEKGLVAGTVIWNTTKLCLDYFDGTNWQCTDGTKTNVHPTKWTPGSGSFTGKAVWGDEAGEVISIAKNNCPTGQTGVLLNYPANTAQQITYTATSNVSQADANQKAIDLMNSAIEAAKRQALAQEYANANGTCQAGSTTYTGTAIWGDDTNEVINATKNNCPTGQTGSTVTYPANTAQHITYTATSTVSQADANQKALALMNSAEKQQERQTLAQNYANQNGTCKSTIVLSKCVDSERRGGAINIIKVGRDNTGRIVAEQSVIVHELPLTDSAKASLYNLPIGEYIYAGGPNLLNTAYGYKHTYNVGGVEVITYESDYTPNPYFLAERLAELKHLGPITHVSWDSERAIINKGECSGTFKVEIKTNTDTGGGADISGK